MEILAGCIDPVNIDEKDSLEHIFPVLLLDGTSWKQYTLLLHKKISPSRGRYGVIT